MRLLVLPFFIAICGCTADHPAAPSSMVPMQAPHPIMAGDVEIDVGAGREITAPPGSATAGSKWIEHTVTYTNTSNAPVWIVGYSQEDPFSGLQTRTAKDNEWCDYGLGYCGTGAREFEIAPHASHTFTTELPETYIGQEFRVMLPYRKTRDVREWVQAASKPHRLARPVAR